MGACLPDVRIRNIDVIIEIHDYKTKQELNFCFIEKSLFHHHHLKNQPQSKPHSDTKTDS